MSWNATLVSPHFITPSLHISSRRLDRVSPYPITCSTTFGRRRSAEPRRLVVIRLLNFSGEQPAEIGQAVEIAENFDVEILVVIY